MCKRVAVRERFKGNLRFCKTCTNAAFERSLRANEATLLSNAKKNHWSLYLGLNYSMRKHLPPYEYRADIGLYITLRQGNSRTAVHSTWEAFLGPGTGCAPNDIIYFSGPPGTQLWWFTIYSHLLLCWILLYSFQLFKAVIYFSAPVV